MLRQERVEKALRGILEIGKRDMSNPKYDGYFAEAREALVESLPVGVGKVGFDDTMVKLDRAMLSARVEVLARRDGNATARVAQKLYEQRPVVLYKVGKMMPGGEQYEEVLVDGVSVTRVYESDDSFIDVRDVLERLDGLGIIQYREELESTAGEDDTPNPDEFCLECGEKLPHEDGCKDPG